MAHTPSNKKVAELSGISASYIDKIRRGDKVPSLAKALQIYRTTGLKFGALTAMPDTEVEQVAKALAA